MSSERASRNDLDVIKAQTHAIEAWTRAHQTWERSARAGALTREMRLDLDRRMGARRREQAAMIARADAQLRLSGHVFATARPLRAVVAHRNEWMTQKITDLLADRKVHVVGAFVDGADAAGTVVAEQPDLVLVEDRLPTLSGVDVVREVREYSPLSVVGAQALDGLGFSALVDAGAHAVFTRRIPPSDIVDQLLTCIVGDVDALRTPSFA